MASMEFPCQHCGHTLRAVPGGGGQRVLCPGCGAFSEMPAVPGDAPNAGAAGWADLDPSAGPPPYGPTPAAEGHFGPAGPGEQGSPFGSTEQWTYGPSGENPYASPTQYGAPVHVPPAATDGRAVASLVLGIIGLVASVLFCCGVAGLPLGGIGLLLGIPAMKSESRGVAIAGVVTSAISLLLGVLTLLAALAFLAMPVMMEGMQPRPPQGF